MTKIYDETTDKPRGLYVMVVGIDGTGKTSLCNWLKTQLNADKTVFTSEPYDRSCIDDKNTDPVIAAYNFAIDRYNHMKNVVIPALNDGNNVISDRGYICNLAYQHFDGLSYERLFCIQPENLIHPDCIIYLSGNPDYCCARSGERDDFRLWSIQNNYDDLLEFIDCKNIISINIENKSIEDVGENLLSRFETDKLLFRIL